MTTLASIEDVLAGDGTARTLAGPLDEKRHAGETLIDLAISGVDQHARRGR